MYVSDRLRMEDGTKMHQKAHGLNKIACLKWTGIELARNVFR